MKSTGQLRIILVMLLLISFSVEALHAPEKAGATGNILYVNANNNSGTYTGASWATAYRRLQNALNNAVSGDQIWVAAAVYYPDEGTVQTNDDPASTFSLKNGVALYGGFFGTETLLSQRNVDANLTILSGDVDNNDTNLDGNFIPEQATDVQGNNAYHVVSGGGTNNTAILDGFVITAGDADFNSIVTEPRSQGGGMHNLNSSPTLNNLIFLCNSAYVGAGMYNASSSPALTNVTFESDRADDGGGGMYNKTGSSPSLTNVTFWNNRSYGSGGGMFNHTGSNPILSNVAFTGNLADHPLYTQSKGGGMLNFDSDPTLTDVTFTGNTSDAWGGGMSSEQSDPRLTNVAFIANSAPIGAGMFNTSANSVLTNVVFIDNQGEQGGGMHLVSSSPVLTNVTFDNNYSLHNGGGMYISIYSHPSLTNVTFGGNQAADYGGAIFTRAYSNPVLTHVTINANGGSYYGGLYNQDHSSPLLKNSLVANNAVGECFSDATSSLNAASSYNLIEDNASACGLTNGVNGNLVGLDPIAGSLQNNGGFGETVALLPGSPAIDAANNSNCPATDQRGVTRPKDGNSDSTATCDMGAYEAEVYANLLVSKSNNVGGQALVGRPFVWKLLVLNSGLQSATFSNGQVILRDNLPTSGAAYGAASVQNLVNVTNSNNLACSISANTLTCSASGGSVTLGAGTGQFEVSFSATPNSVVTLVNPRAGGVCSADPDNIIAESVESNNDCLLNTVNARTPVYLPLIAR